MRQGIYRTFDAIHTQRGSTLLAFHYKLRRLLVRAEVALGAQHPSIPCMERFCHHGGKGQWKQALTQAQQVLILMQELMMQSKGLRNSTHQMALGIAHLQIGWALQRCGRLGDARGEFDKALGRSSTMDDSDPECSIVSTLHRVATENASMLQREEEQRLISKGYGGAASQRPQTGTPGAQKNRPDGRAVHPFLSKQARKEKKARKLQAEGAEALLNAAKLLPRPQTTGSSAGSSSNGLVDYDQRLLQACERS